MLVGHVCFEGDERKMWDSRTFSILLLPRVRNISFKKNVERRNEFRSKINEEKARKGRKLKKERGKSLGMKARKKSCKTFSRRRAIENSEWKGRVKRERKK